jgi:hypothetical protein
MDKLHLENLSLKKHYSLLFGLLHGLSVCSHQKYVEI